MKCHNCGAEARITTGDHRYAAGDGLYVLLKGVKKTKCDVCGEEGVVIPKINQLNEALAKAIAKRPERIEPGEIRFLRKYLGWSGKDFAKRMEVTPETVSRWETGTRQMGATAEKLLRFSAIELGPVEEYPIPELNNGKKARSLELVLDKEWRVVA
jgi:putative zinc finger/helix-turn-helix YgiT family protein